MPVKRLRPLLTDAEQAQIAASYLAGMREAKLAIAYQVSRAYVHNTLLRLDVSMRSQTEVNRAIAAAKTSEQHHANIAAARRRACAICGSPRMTPTSPIRRSAPAII